MGVQADDDDLTIIRFAKTKKSKKKSKSLPTLKKFLAMLPETHYFFFLGLNTVRFFTRRP